LLAVCIMTGRRMAHLFHYVRVGKEFNALESVPSDRTVQLYVDVDSLACCIAIVPERSAFDSMEKLLRVVSMVCRDATGVDLDLDLATTRVERLDASGNPVADVTTDAECQALHDTPGMRVSSIDLIQKISQSLPKWETTLSKEEVVVGNHINASGRPMPLVDIEALHPTAQSAPELPNVLGMLIYRASLMN